MSLTSIRTRQGTARSDWWTAAFIYAVAVACFFGPVLTGRMALWGPDLKDLFHPYLLMAQERLQAGRLALWTPEVGLGYPLLSEGQALQLYPPAVLLLRLLPAWWAMGWLIASHFWLAAMGTYGLARRRGQPSSSALLAGFTYAFSGFFTLRYIHPTVLVVGALLPVFLCAIDSALAPRLEPRLRKIARWIVAGGVLTLMLLGGHHQFTFYGLSVALAFLIFRLMPGSRKVEPIVAGRWALGGFAICLFAGFGAACLPLMATREMTPLLLRHALPPEIFAGGFGFPVENILLGALPHLWGNAETYTGASLFWEACPYLTVLPWIAALGGWVAAPRDRNIWFWTLIALLGLPFAITDGNPLQAVLLHIPGWATFRVASRVLVVTVLAGALLLGHSHALLLQAPPAARQRARRVLTYVAIGGVALLLLANLTFCGGQNILLSLLQRHTFAVPVKTRADAMYNSLGGGDALYLLLHLTLGVGAFIALTRPPRGGSTRQPAFLQRGATILLLLLLFGDFWRVSIGRQERISPAYWSYTPASIQFLQKQKSRTQPFRVWTAQDANSAGVRQAVPSLEGLPDAWSDKWLLLPGQNALAGIPNVQSIVGLELLRSNNITKPTALSPGGAFLSATDEESKKPLINPSCDLQRLNAVGE